MSERRDSARRRLPGLFAYCRRNAPDRLAKGRVGRLRGRFSLDVSWYDERRFLGTACVGAPTVPRLQKGESEELLRSTGVAGVSLNRFVELVVRLYAVIESLKVLDGEPGVLSSCGEEHRSAVLEREVSARSASFKDPTVDKSTTEESTGEETQS